MSNTDSLSYLHISSLTLQYGGQTFCQSWKLDRSSSTIWQNLVTRYAFFHFSRFSQGAPWFFLEFYLFTNKELELRAAESWQYKQKYLNQSDSLVCRQKFSRNAKIWIFLLICVSKKTLIAVFVSVRWFINKTSNKIKTNQVKCQKMKNFNSKIPFQKLSTWRPAGYRTDQVVL